MKRRLISERVKFERRRRGWRYWFANDRLHRNDGGPSSEDVSTGYRAWWELGNFVKNNR